MTDTITDSRPTLHDPLVHLLSIADQRAAAGLAQRIFGELFRNSFATAPEIAHEALSQAESDIMQWCSAGDGDAAQTGRLALLAHGLDQWGLAYVQAFNLAALPVLSALIGQLRSRLDARSDALFQQSYAQITEAESAAIDFKVELRRGIHLALWLAMTACDTPEEAASIVQPLGSLMLGLHRQMPEYGWRLLADTLAHIQIRLLEESGLSDVARDGTQQLFEALLHALPKETALLALRHSGEAVVAWQQAQRPRN